MAMSYDSHDGWTIGHSEARRVEAGKAFAVSKAILSVLKPKYRHGEMRDLSWVASFVFCRDVAWMESIKDNRHKEIMLGYLRALEQREWVRNTDGVWSLTASGAVWLLLAETSPSAWERTDVLFTHMDLRWWSHRDLFDAITNPEEMALEYDAQTEVLRLRIQYPPLMHVFQGWRE